ncbi:hypothetical protein LCGC14_2920140 [marine sediment metagenome]|uniref:Uncharacterized protein n=1 Tax=marine sediment metagenome TaxID=412755 RepID=A0A0F8ZWL4_9ZZZZ
MTEGVSLQWFRHALAESPFLEHVRRAWHRGDPDRLLEYVNLDTERRIIALWVNRLQGTIVELASYHWEDDPPSYEHVLQCLFNLNNDLRMAALQEVGQQMVSDEYRRFRLWADDEEERRHQREFRQRRIPNQDRRKDPRWFAAI